jgi:hypothetical protein
LDFVVKTCLAPDASRQVFYGDQQVMEI